MNETSPVLAQGSCAKKQPDPVTLTEAAAKRLGEIAAKAEGAVGVRLSFTARGCSGQKYEMDVVREVNPDDILVEQHGARFYIDRKAELYVVGLTIDYKSDKMQSGFVFKNPNETGRCGCGESVMFQ